MIKDSGNRTKFDSGAVRDIQEGKGRCDLLPLDIIDLWCDDGLKHTLYHVGEYLKKNGTTDYFQFILDHFAAEHQAKRIASGEDDEMIYLDQYKWNLVLEVAKHFEEGAKKYGDRNWEKGIPCDRYIDSAVRHYCKWRAGWTDEPHDRAFVWNILCCEWTRQRYGWNLERLEKSEAEKGVKIGKQLSKGIQDGLVLMSSLYDEEDVKKIRWGCSQLTETGTSLEQYDGIHFNDDTEITMTVEGDFSNLFDMLGTEEPKKDQEINEKTDIKAVNQLIDHAKKSLNGGEEISNGYIRYVTGGVELYDDSGDYVGYVHGFLISKEDVAIIRSIVQECWGLLTFNPHTLKKIIEDHGYISDVHFLVELYKDPSDIKLPEKWQLIKRIAKEDSK